MKYAKVFLVPLHLLHLRRGHGRLTGVDKMLHVKSLLGVNSFYAVEWYIYFTLKRLRPIRANRTGSRRRASKKRSGATGGPCASQ